MGRGREEGAPAVESGLEGIHGDDVAGIAVVGLLDVGVGCLTDSVRGGGGTGIFEMEEKVIGFILFAALGSDVGRDANVNHHVGEIVVVFGVEPPEDEKASAGVKAFFQGGQCFAKLRQDEIGLVDLRKR